jgi:hypothetical protein
MVGAEAPHISFPIWPVRHPIRWVFHVLLDFFHHTQRNSLGLGYFFIQLYQLVYISKNPTIKTASYLRAGLRRSRTLKYGAVEGFFGDTSNIVN